MYAAVLELQIWMGTMIHFYEGDTVSDIIRQFESMQDLSCLVRMGRMEEGKKGQKEIDKIEDFLDKYYSDDLTIDDLKGFSFTLSIGSFRCVDTAEGEDAIAALKAAHPEAK